MHLISAQQALMNSNTGSAYRLNAAAAVNEKLRPRTLLADSEWSVCPVGANNHLKIIDT